MVTFFIFGKKVLPYYYSLVAKNESNAIVKEEQNSFTTLAPSQIYSINTANLNIFPNPATESFNTSGITEPTVVMVLDITGKIVLQQTIIPDEIINIAHLQSGIYFVNVKGENMKLIKW